MASRSSFLMVGAATAAIATVWWVAGSVPAEAPPMARPDSTGMPGGTQDLSVTAPAATAAALAASTPAADRFKLIGVLVDGTNSRALIAVNGQAVRALRQGETVEGDVVVQRMTAEGATLGPRDGAGVVSLRVEAAPAALPGIALTAPVPSTAMEDLPDPSKGTPAQPKAFRDGESKYRAIQKPATTAQPGTGSTPVVVDDGAWKPPGK